MMPQVNANTDKPSNDAFSRIIRLVEYSDRTVYQTRRRLIDEGWNEEEIDAAIERACSAGILDDERYAQAYCRSRLARNIGMPGIVRELKHKGIYIEDFEGFPEEYLPISEEDELNRAIEYLDYKSPRGKNIRSKAYESLVRRGYASSVSSTAARIWCDKIANVSEAKSYDFY